jgi:hypothetical protein
MNKLIERFFHGPESEFFGSRQKNMFCFGAGDIKNKINNDICGCLAYVIDHIKAAHKRFLFMLGSETRRFGWTTSYFLWHAFLLYDIKYIGIYLNPQKFPHGLIRLGDHAHCLNSPIDVLLGIERPETETNPFLGVGTEHLMDQRRYWRKCAIS